MKDTSKKPPSGRKGRKKAPVEEPIQDTDGENIELDVNLHCRGLTVRELEFSMVGHPPWLRLGTVTFRASLCVLWKQKIFFAYWYATFTKLLLPKIDKLFHISYMVLTMNISYI